MQFGDESQSIVLFEQEPVRRTWHDGRWFYSVIDVCAILTQSSNPRVYWAKLKERLPEEGAREVLTNCQQLKLRAPDGKMRETDCGDTETILRIMQSIPSPKAEPFKRWMASIGADVIEDRTEDQKRLEYYDVHSGVNRKLHKTVHTRGVRTPRQHGRFQNSGYEGQYAGETADDIGERKGIPEGDSITKWMGSEEIGDNIFREVQTDALITRMDIRGEQNLNDAHRDVGRKVREFIAELGGTMPEDLPTPRKSIDQVRKDEERRRTKGMDLFPELDEPDSDEDDSE
jgi:DNA-damage-inducible protein D